MVEAPCSLSVYAFSNRNVVLIACSGGCGPGRMRAGDGEDLGPW